MTHQPKKTRHERSTICPIDSAVFAVLMLAGPAASQGYDDTVWESPNDHVVTHNTPLNDTAEAPPRTITQPRFTIEAIGFTAIDESGYDLMGSDEIVAVWNSHHGVGAVSRYFEDVDSGDYVAFHHLQSCIAPISATTVRDASFYRNTGWGCKPEGAAAPLNFEVELAETDFGGYTFCPPQRGVRAVVPTCKSTDFIGDYEQTWTEDELVAMLPSPGNSKHITMRLNDCGCGVVGHGVPSLPDYDFHIRITRVADVEVRDNSDILS